MDWTSIVVGALALIGTLAGSYFSNRKSGALIAYRLEILEKKVQAHNTLVERTFRLEQREEVMEEKMNGMRHLIEQIEKEMEK